MFQSLAQPISSFAIIIHTKFQIRVYQLNIFTDFNVEIGVWKGTKVAVTSWSSPFFFYLSFLTRVEHQCTIKYLRNSADLLNISVFRLPFTATSEKEWWCCVWPKLLFNLSHVIKGDNRQPGSDLGEIGDRQTADVYWIARGFVFWLASDKHLATNNLVDTI